MPKQKPMKWVLPEIVDPPETVCFQINVPKERFHLAAFYGAIFLLSKPYAWGDDPDHTAIEVGAVWRKIFDKLIGGNCTIPPKLGSAGADAEDNLIRQNPDSPCLLETSIDGVNWCAFADLSKCFGAPNQPGPGAPQPPAGGGCETYHGFMGASSGWYVPTVVNTGDTVELVDANGTWNDGGELAWRCFDGGVFFAGANTGVKAFDGGDPMPAVPHMAMIASIDGTFYDLTSGPITVSGGVSNGQVIIQPNDSVISNNQGSMEFDIKVCNNEAAPWCTTRIFGTSPAPWTSYSDGLFTDLGVWNAGLGWGDTQQIAAGIYFVAAGTQADGLTASHLTDVDFVYDVVTGTNDSGHNPGIQLFFNNTLVQSIAWDDIVTGTNQHLVWHGSATGVTKISLFVGASNVIGGPYGGGSALIKSMQICGVGPQPSI